MKSYSRNPVLRVAVNGNVRCEINQTLTDTVSLRIVGEIDWYKNNADSVSTAFNELKKNGVSKLKAYINSPGGSSWEANEIYNLIIENFIQENRSLDIGALCASAATIIASAFPKANTRAFKNVVWMMHNHRMVIEGEERDLSSGSTLLKNLDENYRKRWAQRMNVSEEFLKSKMDSTWWLSSNELLSYNIISEFIDKEDMEIAPNTKQLFNKLGIAIPVALSNQLNNQTEKPYKSLENGSRIYGSSSEVKKDIREIPYKLINGARVYGAN